MLKTAITCDECKRERQDPWLESHRKWAPGNWLTLKAVDADGIGRYEIDLCSWPCAAAYATKIAARGQANQPATKA